MSTNIYYIYRITNTVVNPPKSYIGFSNNPNRRFTMHCSNAKNKRNRLYLARAIRKYGKTSFKLEILYCSKDKEYILNTMEEYFIRLYNTHYKDGYGYNMTYGGEGGSTIEGRHLSEETKHKISVAGKLRKDVYLPKSEFTKKKMSEVQARPYLITFPDGHQENISGLNQFCKLHNLSQSAMSEVFAGHRPRHKQFKCAKVA